MAKMRQLNDEEKKMANRMLVSKTSELTWLAYQIKYHKLMIYEGLRENYEKMLREYKLQRNEYEQQFKFNEETIKVLKDQIRNGVEVKKEVPVEDEVTTKDSQTETK